jgi:hypothetical protein
MTRPQACPDRHPKASGVGWRTDHNAAGRAARFIPPELATLVGKAHPDAPGADLTRGSVAVELDLVPPSVAIRRRWSSLAVSVARGLPTTALQLLAKPYREF